MEKGSILGDYADTLSKRIELDVTEILAVYEDPTAGRLVEAEE